MFKKITIRLCTAFMLMGTLTVKAGIVNVAADITANTTWTKNNVYVLQGYRFVKNGAVLTIEPGTVIHGDKATKGTLVITRGSQIMANGTPCEPIVFTSNEPVGQRSAGDWGGVILLGNATINVPGGTAIIEGGINNAANDAVYGGTNDADNSGQMTYVRIEYPGIAFQPNSEINGLTFGGVGSGTTIHHIQVAYSGDDAYEWFGGTVNCSHLVALGTQDDDFDTDLGFSGKVQFCLAVRDNAIADISGSNAFESDNDGVGSTNTPFTGCTFSNVTVFGPNQYGALNANYRNGMHLRRNTHIGIFNTVILGWNNGLLIDGTAAANNANNGILNVANTYMANMFTADFSTSSSQMANVTSWFDSTVFANYRNPQVGYLYTQTFALDNIQPVPQAGSPLLTAGNFADARLTGFVNTNYAGAFGTDDWTANWVSFDPQNMVYAQSHSNGVNVPSQLTVQAVNQSGVQMISWSAVTGAIRYHVAIRQAGQTNWNNPVLSDTSATNATLTTPLLSAGNYEAVVRAKMGNHWTSFTCAFPFSSNGLNTSVNALNAFELKVYPNPASQVVFITAIEEAGIATLYNAIGQPVRSITLQQGTVTQPLNIDGLSSGMYLLQVKTKTGTAVQKVMVK